MAEGLQKPVSNVGSYIKLVVDMRTGAYSEFYRVINRARTPATRENSRENAFQR